MADQIQNQEAMTSEMDLGRILFMLWQKKKLIITGVFLTTLLAVIISLLIPKTYSSSGFFQLGGVHEGKADIGLPIPVYKAISRRLFDPNHFQSMLRQDDTITDQVKSRLSGKFRFSDKISLLMKPVYSFSKEDARIIFQSNGDDKNMVLGLDLTFKAQTAQQAFDLVQFLGRYIRKSLLYVVLYEHVVDRLNAYTTHLNAISTQILDLQFKILQNDRSLMDLRVVMNKYPKASSIENRQLVSIQEGGSRFLSPITQLIGIESELSYQRRTLEDLERNKEEASIKQAYFSICKNESEVAQNDGELFLSMLKSIKDRVLQGEDPEKDSVKKFINSLNNDLQLYENAYLSNCRFVSGPTLPTSHIAPRKSIIVLAAFFISGFFFVFLALILVWWKDHRQDFL